MVVVQLDVGPAEAVAAIRARAYATDRPAGEVAADVVARRFRFDQDGTVTPPGELAAVNTR